MNEEIGKLERALKGLKKPVIDAHMKMRIRSDVLNQITKYKEDSALRKELPYLPSTLNKLRGKINKLAQFVEPPIIMRVKVKERVLSFIENTYKTRTFLWRFVHNWQKVTASVLVLLIVMTSFTVYIADIPVTKAARQTVFQEVFGVVNVIRDKMALDAVEGMSLIQGDIVVTGENGIAIIRYLDDSVTRLSPETELKINKIYQDGKDKTKTEVEVELKKGRIWSQVVNLVNDQSSFKVATTDIVTSTSNKASFDVKNTTKEKNVKVSVFENTVEVTLADKSKEKAQFLLQGYSLEVDKKEPKIDRISLSQPDKDDELWVQLNKAKDDEYKDEIEEETTKENKEEAGLLPEDPLYPVKMLNEATKMLVITDEEAKGKLKVDIAIKRLIEGSVLLSEGKTDSANSSISEFNLLVDEISQLVKDSEELSEYANAVFNEEAKDLSVVLPDSSLYPAKQALRSAKEKLAVTSEEKKQTTLEHASEKMIEAKELIEENKEEIAAETIEEVNKNVSGLSNSDYENTNGGIIDAQVDTLTTVKVLKEVVENDDKAERVLHKLVEDTQEIISGDLEESILDSDVVLEVNDYIEETDPGVSDIAVIIPVSQE